jgi:DNA-binding transcriptional MocR family regulator
MVLDLLQATGRKDVAQLGAALPDASFFPSGQLRHCALRAARTRAQSLEHYALAPGLPALRETLARKMLGMGCDTRAAELVVTHGCHEAILLSLKAVTKPGDIVALESPTYYGLLQIVDSLNLKALEIPCHEETGMDPQALKKACELWDVKACVVVGNFSNPLGSCPDESRKKALLEILRECDVAMIEDDIYGDLAFDGSRPAPYKKYDTAGQVLYCSSFSKTVSPGLRTGWVAPGRYLERVRYLKFTQNLANASLDQHILDFYLRTGNLDRHLRKVRNVYAGNIARALELVRSRFPAGTAASHPAGGFVLWIQLPREHSAMQLYEAALEEKISVAPGPLFTTTKRYEHCLRVNCALPWEDELEPALKCLAALVNTLR